MSYPVPGFKDDDELLGYARIHADTPRGLFSGAQIKRIFVIAGLPEPTLNDDEFRSMDTEDMAEIDRLIKEKQDGEAKREGLQAPLPSSDLWPIRSEE